MTNYPGWFAVQFPASVVPGRVTWKSLDVLQDINKHDVAMATFSSYTSSYEDVLGPGTPVTLQYGSRGRSASFVGVVAKISPHKKIGTQYEHTITVVAASRQLRATARNTWRNKTCPEVAQQIGSKLGFKVVTKQHTMRRRTVTQAGESYWKLLTDLANLCGYAVRVEGTTIYFLPIPDMVRVFRTSAPQLTFDASSSRTRLIEFSAAIGNTSDDPEDLADATIVTAFGPNDTNFTDVVERPSSAVRGSKKYTTTYERSSPSVIAYTREEARALARGMADRGAMAYDAHLVCGGEPGLAPYHPVFVHTGNQTTAGWWITKSVRHTIANKEYTCEGVVSSDEVSQQDTAIPPVVPVRDPVTESEYSSAVGTTILDVSQSAQVVGVTYTANNDLARWVNTNPGVSLSQNTGLLYAESSG